MTQINAELLWQSIAWVEWRYTEDSPNCSRQQRPYQANDGKILAKLIKKIRANYHAEKNLLGKEANFKNCKEKVLQAKQKEQSWSEATRNFYSSVVSTYIMWNYQGIPEAEKNLIYQIAAYKSYVTNTSTPAHI